MARSCPGLVSTSGEERFHEHDIKSGPGAHRSPGKLWPVSSSRAMSCRLNARIGYIMQQLPAMTNYWLLATVLCYAASLAGYIAFLATSNRGAGRAATLLLAVGLAAHYMALVDRSRGAHTVPYNDLYGSLSLFAWLLAATYLGLEFFHRQRSVGAFVLPVVLIVMFFSGRGTTAPVTPPTANGPLLALHITMNVLGYAAFALSFVLSLIYLVQNQLLRRHRLQSVVWRFPLWRPWSA